MCFIFRSDFGKESIIASGFSLNKIVICHKIGVSTLFISLQWLLKQYS